MGLNKFVKERYSTVGSRLSFFLAYRLVHSYIYREIDENLYFNLYGPLVTNNESSHFSYWVQLFRDEVTYDLSIEEEHD